MGQHVLPEILYGCDDRSISFGQNRIYRLQKKKKEKK